MAKKLSPALFDITADIADFIPSDLISAWVKSDQSQDLALEILEPFKISGTLVSSDTSGLSKMSREKELIEVMAIVNQPKEIIHSLGKSIGGVAGGIWAADNTQMFYHDKISLDEIIDSLVKAQHLISKNCQVQIGLGVHTHEFYTIGNGYYGVEAQRLELMAEDFSGPGEIVVTPEVLKKLDSKHKYKEIDLTKEGVGKIYSILTRAQQNHLKTLDYVEDLEYPRPFSKEFHDDIRSFQKKHFDLAQLNNKYIKNKTVVLIERDSEGEGNLEVDLLNDLSLDVAMSKVAINLLQQFEGKKIKVLGRLGIFTFSDSREAYEFTEIYHQKLAEYDAVCKSAITKGDVLIFNLDHERKEIAGSPVNIASKLAQDNGTAGFTYLDPQVYQELKLQGFSPSTIEVSGINLEHYSKKLT